MCVHKYDFEDELQALNNIASTESLLIHLTQ